MHKQNNENEPKPKPDLFGLLFYKTVNLASQRGKTPHTETTKHRGNDQNQARKKK